MYSLMRIKIKIDDGKIKIKLLNNKRIIDKFITSELDVVNRSYYMVWGNLTYWFTFVANNLPKYGSKEYMELGYDPLEHGIKITNNGKIQTYDITGDRSFAVSLKMMNYKREYSYSISSIDFQKIIKIWNWIRSTSVRNGPYNFSI